MTTFTIKELGTILEMLEKHDVREFKLERGEEKISLRRGRPLERRVRTLHPMPQIVPSAPQFPSNVIPLVNPTVNPTATPVPAPASQTSFATSGVGREASAQTMQTAAAVETVPKKALKEVTSPMVGTFYRRPAVDAEPYVGVGDSVKKGDVLCIVEAMKLMNEIESDTAGRIAEICLEDGQMVEYGEVLFRIEPF